jgi:hypothetical protein
MTEAAQRTKDFIEGEMSQIENDFHKGFYMIAALPKVLSTLVEKNNRVANLSRDYKAAKLLAKFKKQSIDLNFTSEEYKNHFKVENKYAKEAWIAMFADVIRILAITIDQITIDRYDELASLLIDFTQGNIARVDEHVIDSLLDYKEKTTIEGLGLVQRYAPHLTVEQKEAFAKDLVKFCDYRNMLAQ